MSGPYREATREEILQWYRDAKYEITAKQATIDKLVAALEKIERESFNQVQHGHADHLYIRNIAREAIAEAKNI